MAKMTSSGLTIPMAAVSAKALLAATFALGALQVSAAEVRHEAVSEPIEEPPAFPATVPEGVPSLQMSLDFASPALAIGVYRPVGEVPSRGVRITPFTFRAWMLAGIGHDDNVRLSTTNKRASMVLILNPSFSAGLEGPLHRYFAVYRGSYARYSSASLSNYENHNLTLQARDEWSTRLRTALQYDYLRAHDPTGSTGSAVTVADPWSVHTARGTVAYGAEGAPAGISATVGYKGRRYLDRESDSRDFEQLDIGGSFSYRLTGKMNAIALVRHADITHDHAPNLDSTETHYAVGVRWEATGKTSGTVRLGYMTKDFVNPAFGNASIPTYEASVTWSPLTYSVFELGARRAFVEAIEIGSSTVVDNYGALSWSHVWSDRTRSTLVAGSGRQSHEGLARVDNYFNFGARGSFRLQRWLYLGAEFRRDARTSTATAFEYTRNVLLFTIESAI